MNLKSRVLQESPSELRNPHGGTGLEGPLPEHGLKAELEQGVGQIPDTIEVKLTGRTVAGTWLRTHLGIHRSLRPSWKLVRNKGRNEHIPDTVKVRDTKMTWRAAAGHEGAERTLKS